MATTYYAPTLNVKASLVKKKVASNVITSSTFIQPGYVKPVVTNIFARVPLDAPNSSRTGQIWPRGNR